MGDFYCSPCGRYEPCDKCAPSPKQGTTKAHDWTPLDDIGRSEAALLHNLRQVGPALRRMHDARERTLASMDRLIAALGDGSVDWSDASEDEACEMAEALDTVHHVRDLLAGEKEPMSP